MQLYRRSKTRDQLIHKQIISHRDIFWHLESCLKHRQSSSFLIKIKYYRPSSVTDSGYILPRNATFVAEDFCGHKIDTFVMIPSVPSDPINKCFK